MTTPLIIDDWERTQLKHLRLYAAHNQIDMPLLSEQLKTPEGKEAHMQRMNSQTVKLSAGLLVTYSIERGHPSGTMRHMSMSSHTEEPLPTHEAVWMVCEALGFKGSLKRCVVWIEELQRGEGRADTINVVQSVKEAVPAGE